MPNQKTTQAQRILQIALLFWLMSQATQAASPASKDNPNKEKNPNLLPLRFNNTEYTQKLFERAYINSKSLLDSVKSTIGNSSPVNSNILLSNELEKMFNESSHNFFPYLFSVVLDPGSNQPKDTDFGIQNKNERILEESIHPLVGFGFLRKNETTPNKPLPPELEKLENVPVLHYNNIPFKDKNIGNKVYQAAFRLSLFTIQNHYAFSMFNATLLNNPKEVKNAMEGIQELRDNYNSLVDAIGEYQKVAQQLKQVKLSQQSYSLLMKYEAVISNYNPQITCLTLSQTELQKLLDNKTLLKNNENGQGFYSINEKKTDNAQETPHKQIQNLAQKQGLFISEFAYIFDSKEEKSANEPIIRLFLLNDNPYTRDNMILFMRDLEVILQKFLSIQKALPLILDNLSKYQKLSQKKEKELSISKKELDALNGYESAKKNLADMVADINAGITLKTFKILSPSLYQLFQNFFQTALENKYLDIKDQMIEDLENQKPRNTANQFSNTFKIGGGAPKSSRKATLTDLFGNNICKLSPKDEKTRNENRLFKARRIVEFVPPKNKVLLRLS